MSNRRSSYNNAGIPQCKLDQLFDELRLEDQRCRPQPSPQASAANVFHRTHNDAIARPASLNLSPTRETRLAGAAELTHLDMNASLQHMFIHDSIVCSVCYSWDGMYLATSSNRAAHIFDARTGCKIASFSEHNALQRDDRTRCDCYVRSVCFTPDGHSLVTGGEDYVVKVWESHSGKIKHRLIGHSTDISSVDASSSNQFIASGSGDGSVKVWNLETGNLLCTLGGGFVPTTGITSVSVSPTCHHVATGCLDGIVRVWDVESTRLVRKFEGHKSAVYSVQFSPDGTSLLSGSLDKAVKLWDLTAPYLSSQCVLTLMGHTDFVLSVAFSPCGRWLISGSKDQTVALWDSRQPRIGLEVSDHNSSVIAVAHNPASAAFATGCGDCRARTWSYSL